MKYKSRVGPWFYLLLAAVTVLAVVGATLYFRSRESVLFCVMLFGCLDILLLLPLLAATDYTFREDSLRIRCGYLVSESIPLRCIRLVRDVQDYTFGPALSFDRIELRYRVAGKDGRLLLSPKDKEGFIRELTQRAGCPYNPSKSEE